MGTADTLCVESTASAELCSQPATPPPAHLPLHPCLSWPAYLLHCPALLPRGPPLSPRFSSDVSKIDDSLPFILNILLAHCASLLGLLTVMCATSPLLLLVLMPMAYVYR